MKKSIIALMGLFTLMACSDDAVQEAEDQGIPMTTNSFNPQFPGYYVPGAGFPPNYAGLDYFSPWDIWFRGSPSVTPTYTYTNMEGDGSSPFVVEITPYLGLAYYDDTNDGLYRDPAQGNALIADLTSGSYPNLYKNGNEIGNLIRADRVRLDGTSLQNTEVSIGSTIDHCPVFQGNVNTGYNPLNRFININNVATSQERSLLSQYGKVHFYEVFIYDRNTGAPIIPPTILQAQVTTLGDPSASWQSTGVTTSFLGQTHNLMYYKDLVKGPGTVYNHNIANGQGVCDSREVVFENKENDVFPFTYNGNSYEIRVIMKQGTALWMASGHHVGVRPI